MAKILTLCQNCADKLALGFRLTPLVNISGMHKVTCAECGRKAYGTTYQLTKEAKK